MIVHQEILQCTTTGHGDVQDLTESVEAVVARSGVSRGLVHVHVAGLGARARGGQYRGRRHY